MPSDNYLNFKADAKRKGSEENYVLRRDGAISDPSKIARNPANDMTAEELEVADQIEYLNRDRNKAAKEEPAPSQKSPAPQSPVSTASPEEVEEVTQVAEETTALVREQAEESADDSNPGSLKSKLAESLKYFAPDLVGGFVGTVLGGVEAGAAGMDYGQATRKQLTDNAFKIEQLEQRDRRLEQQDVQFNKRMEQDQKQFDKMYQLKLAELGRKRAESLSKMGEGLTKGQEALDKAFAKNFAEQLTTGSTQNIERNVAQLDDAIELLRSTGMATGSVAGTVPEFLARRLPGIKTGQKARDYVQEVVQQNLKNILGGQFSEREAERLMERAFSSEFSEEENIKRIGRLKAQIQAAAASNRRALEYFNEKGTLKGFDGKLYRSESDFDLTGDSEVDPLAAKRKRREELLRKKRGGQ